MRNAEAGETAAALIGPCDSDDDESAPLIDHTSAPAPVIRALPKDLPALHTIRLIGAIHIAIYHTAPGPPYGPGAAWGASWVPFYFLLSGFGPAHSRLLQELHVEQPQKLPLQPSRLTLWRRLAAVYPTHVLGVLLSLGAAMASHKPPRFGELSLELVLLHAWVPASWSLGYCVDEACTDYVSIAYNMPSWFVSVLMGCWLLEAPAFRLGAHLCRLRHTAVWSALLFVVWVLAWPWARCPLTWNQRWWNAVDVLTYIHLYAAGAVLAHVMHARAARGAPALSWAASVAAAGLAALFALDTRWLLGTRADPMFIDHWTHKVGLLLPLHALLVVGLAEGTDPLARLCATRPLPALRHLALGAYLLQAPTYELLTLASGWPTPFTSAPAHELALLAALMLVAAAAHAGVQQPLGAAMLRCCADADDAGGGKATGSGGEQASDSEAARRR